MSSVLATAEELTILLERQPYAIFLIEDKKMAQALRLTFRLMGRSLPTKPPPYKSVSILNQSTQWNELTEEHKLKMEKSIE